VRQSQFFLRRLSADAGMRNRVICVGIRSGRGYQHRCRRCARADRRCGRAAARTQCPLACRVQRRLARGCAAATWSTASASAENQQLIRGV